MKKNKNNNLKKKFSRRVQMDSPLKFIWFNDILSAWESINEDFIKNHSKSMNLRSDKYKTYTHDFSFGIMHPEKLDEDFSLGKQFHYTKIKWANLINCYIDKDSLLKFKSDVISSINFKNNIYSIGYQFSNSHKNGKNCLLSMSVYSSFSNTGKKFLNLSIYLRSTEVTKRLLIDLILFKRLGDFIFGGLPYTLTIHTNILWNNSTTLLMYDVHRNIGGLLKGNIDERSKFLLSELKYLKETNIDNIKYKIFKRVLKVLQPQNFKQPDFKIRDCKLNID